MDNDIKIRFYLFMHLLRLISGFLAAAFFGIANCVAVEPPSSRLANDIIEYSKQTPASPAQTVTANAPQLDEAREIARLEALPAVKIPISDAPLASAIQVAAESASMNLIGPSPEDFGENVTITATINPWKLLQLMAERYRFSMHYQNGMWLFSRESAGALIGKTYELRYANLDKLTSAAQASEIGTSSGSDGGRSVGQGFGLVYKVDASKVTEDLRILIGLPPLASQTAIARDGKIPEQEYARSEAAASRRSNDEADPIQKRKDDGQRVLYLPNTNAIYVVCYRSQHDHVAEYIHQLDQPPMQVRIEARLFATSEDPQKILGIDYSDAMPRVGLNNLTTGVDLNHITRTRLPSQAVLSSTNLAIQLDALERNSSSEQIQAPFVVTMNNQEALFSVGSEEPFLDSSTLSPGAVDGGLGSTTNRISVKRIGTSVNVVPTYFKGGVGEPGRIRLAIKMEVGRLTAYRQVTPQVRYPVVDSQKYEFTVTIEEGQAIAFGGLTGMESSKDTTAVSGISKVPLIGALFRHKNVSGKQRRLVGYLIPSVIHDIAGEAPAIKLSKN